MSREAAAKSLREFLEHVEEMARQQAREEADELRRNLNDEKLDVIEQAALEMPISIEDRIILCLVAEIRHLKGKAVEA